MKLVSWERFQELNHLKQEINRLFDRILLFSEPRTTEYRVGIPSIEIQELADYVDGIVTLKLPNKFRLLTSSEFRVQSSEFTR